SALDHPRFETPPPIGREQHGDADPREPAPNVRALDDADHPIAVGGDEPAGARTLLEHPGVLVQQSADGLGIRPALFADREKRQAPFEQELGLATLGRSPADRQIAEAGEVVLEQGPVLATGTDEAEAAVLATALD